MAVFKERKLKPSSSCTICKYVELLNFLHTIFRRLLPAYSSLSQFPQLVFIKDNIAEYEEEMEHLIQKARNTDRYTEESNESDINNRSSIDEG